MVDLLSVENSQLNRGMQLLRDQVSARGWTADVPYIGSPHCFIDRGDGKPIHIFATTPPDVSYATAHLANDKYATYQVLKQLDVRQPETVLTLGSEPSSEVIDLLQRSKKVVVKPLDAGHGKGITVGVTSKDGLRLAMTYALTHSRSSDKVIVQQQYEHPEIYDIRLTFINFKFVAAMHRVPAWVATDGQSSLAELIDSENASDKRGVAYHSPLARIDAVAACEYLGDEQLRVYPAGSEVQVLGIANYGAGGEINDLTDEIPDWMLKIAEEIALKMQLPVCGIDFLTRRVPTATSTTEDLDAVLIEINKSPSLAIHDLPTNGQPRSAVSSYVDYLAHVG